MSGYVQRSRGTSNSDLGEDWDKAIENVKASVPSILHYSMRFGLEGQHVLAELKTKIQTYVDGYVLYDHVLNEGENPWRMEALGLTDYVLKRYARAGNPSDWIARIETMAQAGATKLWVGVGGGDLDRQLRTMRLLGEQVMARFV